MYVDFPYNERIKIGNDAISTNLLSLLSPSNLQIQYSTQGNGLKCYIGAKDAASRDSSLATKYYTSGIPTTWRRERIPFTTMDSSRTLDIQIRNAVNTSANFGDFAFDNF